MKANLTPKIRSMWPTLQVKIEKWA